MKKRIGALLITGAMLLTASCTKIDINTAELASKLATEGEFAETLTEVPEDIAIKRYGIGDAIECVAYSGTRAIVDEVAVIKTEHAEAAKEKVEIHILHQIESYTDYRPDEVPKLEDSIVKVVGDCVIVCVSEDSSLAEKIIDEYIK